MDLTADASAVRQFVRFAQATGLALTTMLDPELREIMSLAMNAERVPAHGIVDMLQICSTLGDRPDLGVAFAAWGNMRGYGPLSLLWDHCPSVAEAIRVNRRFVHVASSALGSVTEEFDDEIAVRHLLLSPARFGGSQFIEATLTLEVRVARLILGEGWSPIRMEFDHPAPRDTRYHRTMFRCPIEFGSDRSALVIGRDDLERQSKTGNAHMLAYLERHLEEADRAWPTDLLHQIEQVVAANLAGGRATLEHVAGVLGMSTRTLQRRLSERQAHFGSLVDTVRKRLAADYLNSETRPNLTHLAHRLGYSDASAASRYLRHSLATGIRKPRE